MPGTRALVVVETGGPAVDELDEALRIDGFDVEHSALGELAARSETGPHPDLVLVSASVGLQRLALLSQRFASGGRAPTVVVFPDGDLAALEACVRGGFDYVTPPYLPSLLRTRVSSCWERWQLTMTVEEMAAAASLREYERELSIAHEIQSGFLPEHVPAFDGWEVATRFEPAKQVGGDFFDMFELVNGQRLGLVVADVCDKGIGAALFMALIRTLVRHTAEHTGTWHLIGGELDFVAPDSDEGQQRADRPAGQSAGQQADDHATEHATEHAADQAAEGQDDQSGEQDEPPAELVPPLLSLGAGPLVQSVTGTNRYLARNHLRQGYFATMFFGVLDPASGALLYINGGHNPPVLLRAAGGHSRLEPTGPAVGMLSDSTYRLGHTSLEPGDALFVYTDGVVEARDAEGRLFGMDRMMDVVVRPGRTADQMLRGVDEAIRRYVGTAEQSDDITMLAVRRTGR